MFRKIFIFAMFATAAGYCFAAADNPQVVTSEVFYTTEKIVTENTDRDVYEYIDRTDVVEVIPTWPIVGTDADAAVSCGTGSGADCSDNIKIVSKIGDELTIENNFSTSNRDGMGWTGGANMLHGSAMPAGFDDECYSLSEMPLMHREMLEDDGGAVLAMSRSSRKICGRGFDAGLLAGVVTDTADDIEIDVMDAQTDADAPAVAADQVRSWVVASGQTLREVLQNWCDKEGWDLVWATSREYPVEASAVFKGRFVDVASALVRNFGRATPIPYAKFYKGNRVLVISTTEE